jgi:hypothetical protein
MMGNLASFAVDESGKIYGKLVVLVREPSFAKRALWRCRCECGREAVVRGDRLRSGRTKSCGVGNCRYPFRKARWVPGYKSWSAMVQRCTNPRSDHWKYYGARGISVCFRWRSSANFLADMGPMPAPGMTIERIDVNGNYEPGNCRWATKEEQRRNMRCSVYVQYRERRMLLMDVIRELGLSSDVVRARLKIGWSLDDALSVPVRGR